MLRSLCRALGVLLPLVLLLASAASAAGPTPWVTPLELDFGPVPVGVAAPQQVVTITNTSATPLTNFAGGGVSAPFNASQDCVISGGIPPGGHCHYFFDFTPTAPGSFTATSSSSTNAGPINVVIHGQGIAASVTADATSLNFGSVRSGNSGATQVVTIRNTGQVTLTQFAGGGVSAPFNASQDCVIPGGIAPGKSCHYFFDFHPTTTGLFSAVSSSLIQGANVTINLQGTSTTSILGTGQRVTPLGLDFGPVGVGQVSPQMEITITNQSALLALNNFAGGGVAAPFNASQDCVVAGGIPPLGSCHYYFTFTPTSAGVFTASSDSTDSAGSFSIALRGTGVGAVAWASPLSIDFGPALLGPTEQQIVTIHNAGLAPLTQFAGGGVSAPFNASQDCVIVGGIPPGGSCHYYLTFNPKTVGTFTTASSSQIGGSNINIALQGTGVPTQHVYLPTVMR